MFYIWVETNIQLELLLSTDISLQGKSYLPIEYDLES